MIKKSIVFALVIVIGAVAATDLEAQMRQRDTRVGLGFGTPNTVLVVRPDPFDFKLGYDFSEGNEFIYLGADFRLLNQLEIQAPLHFSLGFGGYTKFYFGEDSEDFFEGGFRTPVALSLLLIDNLLELYVEVAPGVDLYPRPSFADDPVQAWLGFTINTGL